MSIIEIAYDKALEGEEFNKIDVSTTPSEIIPVCPEKVSDWIDDGIEVEEELVSLAKRIREVALPALVDYFEFDQEIGGIRATDLFSLNSLMGATIEDQVVNTLNKHRNTWDDGHWGEYTFVRSAQAFPDVRLVHRSNSEDIKLGIELKSWFLLSKEGEPSMRFVPRPDACAALDMVCVVPWYLSNAVCGKPQVARPWVQQAKYATKWSMFFWQFLRQTDKATTLESRKFKAIPPCSPYPKKSDNISLHPVNDSGGNYGRLPRYRPIMDTFCEEALNTEILGIKAESWRYFLQIQTDSVTVNDIKKKLASKFGITDFSDSDRVIELISSVLRELPENLVR